MRVRWLFGGSLAAAVLALILALPSSAPFSGDNGLRLWAARSGTGTLLRALPEEVPSTAFPPALTRPGRSGLRPAYGELMPALLSLGGLLRSPLAWRLLLGLISLAAIPLLGVLAGTGGAPVYLAAGLLPYSLLFWEHGPAVSLFLLAAVLLVRSLRDPSAPWWIPVAALAIRLRPELLPATAAMVAVVVGGGRKLPGFRTTLVWSAGAAGLAALGALLLPDVVVGRQILANQPSVSGGWLTARISVLSAWTLPLKPDTGASLLLWGLGSAVLLCGAHGRRIRRLALTCGLAGGLALLYPVARGTAGSMSILSLTPAIVLLPAGAYCAKWRHLTILRAGAAGATLVFLLSPTAGMFQFGPRFLLGSLSLLAAGGAGALLSIPNRKLKAASICLALLLSALGAARGAVFCGYFRRTHQVLSESLERHDGDVVCTDEEWMPLVCWAQAVRGPLLVMRPDQAESLHSAGMPVVWLSSRTALGGMRGESGFRGLRYSLPRGSSRCLPPAPPGELAPDPPLLGI